MPKLSIIVPIYNVEDYLSRCIDSILIQIYNDFEVILINDGSTDGSGSICDFYAKQDERVKVIHMNNSGVMAARFAGIAAAIGKYITFIDSDDWIEGNAYQNFIEVMEQNNDIDICIGAYVVVTEYYKVIDPVMMEEEKFLSRDEAIYHMFANKIFTCSLWDKVYRKSLFSGKPVCKDDIFYGEDTAANWELFNRATKIYYKPVKAYHYYMHNDSAMHKAFTIDRLKYIDVLVEIEQKIDKEQFLVKARIAELIVIHSIIYIYQMMRQSDFCYEETVKHYQGILQQYYPLVQCVIEGSPQNMRLVAVLPYKDGCAYIDQQLKLLREQCINFCTKYQRIYIYGAGVIAGEIADLMDKEKLAYHGFVVTQHQENPITYHKRAVIDFIEFQKIPKEGIGIILAVNKKYHMQIIDKLQSNGYFNYFNAACYNIRY